MLLPGDYDWDNLEWARAYFHCPVSMNRLWLSCPEGCRAITPEVVRCKAANILLVHNPRKPETICVLMQTMQYRYSFDYPPEPGESILESVRNIVGIVKALCNDWATEDAVKYRLAGGLWN